MCQETVSDTCKQHYIAVYWQSSDTKTCVKKLSQILANNIDNGGRGIGLRIYVRYCSFKKHFNEIMNEKRNEDFSSLFYFLPSILDRKETINQWKKNPSLSPIDFDIEFINSFSSQNEKFRPDLLNSFDPKLRDPQVEILYALSRQMTQISNQNSQRNVAHLNLKQGRNMNEMEWSDNRLDSSKFKLTY